MNEGKTLIDTRNKFEFANAHIPNSINIQNNKTFNTWMGWVMNYETPFMLVVSDENTDEVTRKLMRIGMDNIYGYITPEDLENYTDETASSILINGDEMENYINDQEVQILDVRNETEFKAGHIEGAKHIFVGFIQDRIKELDPNKKVALHCQAGDRSAIAQSLLEKAGFKLVENYSGGMADWKKNQKPLVK